MKVELILSQACTSFDDTERLSQSARGASSTLSTIGRHTLENASVSYLPSTQVFDTVSAIAHLIMRTCQSSKPDVSSLVRYRLTIPAPPAADSSGTKRPLVWEARDGIRASSTDPDGQ
jgi:hypothetical protein